MNYMSRMLQMVREIAYPETEREPKEEFDAFAESKEQDYIPGQDDGEGPPTREEELGDLRE